MNRLTQRQTLSSEGSFGQNNAKTQRLTELGKAARLARTLITYNNNMTWFAWVLVVNLIGGAFVSLAKATRLNDPLEVVVATVATVVVDGFLIYGVFNWL